MSLSLSWLVNYQEGNSYFFTPTTLTFLSLSRREWKIRNGTNYYAFYDALLIINHLSHHHLIIIISLDLLLALVINIVINRTSNLNRSLVFVVVTVLDNIRILDYYIVFLISLWSCDKRFHICGLNLVSYNSFVFKYHRNFIYPNLRE